MVRYHRKSSKKKYFVLLFFIAITMGVGYAYLSSTLTFNSATVIKKGPDFATDSWETIIANVKKGNGKFYTVGDTRTIDMGKFGTHTLRLANTSTPAECSTTGFSQTACGFVVEFADVITTHVMNTAATNIGGWPSSEMYNYVQNDIYNALPTDLKSKIIETYTVSGHGAKDAANFTSIDKLYFLSAMEIWGKEETTNPVSGDTAEAETRQLDYYKAQGVTTINYSATVKLYNESVERWWTRTAASFNENFFYYVLISGYWNHTYGDMTLGISPAFRLG